LEREIKKLTNELELKMAEKEELRAKWFEMIEK